MSKREGKMHEVGTRFSQKKQTKREKRKKGPNLGGHCGAKLESTTCNPIDQAQAPNSTFFSLFTAHTYFLYNNYYLQLPHLLFFCILSSNSYNFN